MDLSSPKQISTIKLKYFVKILTQSYAENSSTKLLTPLANYSGKSTRHENAETAKPWVDTSFVAKVPDASAPVTSW